MARLEKLELRKMNHLTPFKPPVGSIFVNHSDLPPRLPDMSIIDFAIGVFITTWPAFFTSIFGSSSPCFQATLAYVSEAGALI